MSFILFLLLCLALSLHILSCTTPNTNPYLFCIFCLRILDLCPLGSLAPLYCSQLSLAPFNSISPYFLHLKSCVNQSDALVCVMCFLYLWLLITDWSIDHSILHFWHYSVFVYCCCSCTHLPTLVLLCMVINDLAKLITVTPTAKWLRQLQMAKELRQVNA